MQISFVVFILFYFVRALFTQTLNFKITIYAIHAEIQTKVNFMGSISFFFSSFLYLWFFWQVEITVCWFKGFVVRSDVGCHRGLPFFKCSLYYDISCRKIFLYVNKFLCNITQFGNAHFYTERHWRGRGLLAFAMGKAIIIIV